jgi:hypothetical protein
MWAIPLRREFVFVFVFRPWKKRVEDGGSGGHIGTLSCSPPRKAFVRRLYSIL